MQSNIIDIASVLNELENNVIKNRRFGLFSLKRIWIRGTRCMKEVSKMYGRGPIYVI